MARPAATWRRLLSRSREFGVYASNFSLGPLARSAAAASDKVASGMGGNVSDSASRIAMTWPTSRGPSGVSIAQQVIPHDRHDVSVSDEVDDLIELTCWKLAGHQIGIECGVMGQPQCSQRILFDRIHPDKRFMERCAPTTFYLFGVIERFIARPSRRYWRLLESVSGRSETDRVPFAVLTRAAGSPIAVLEANKSS